MIPFRHVIRFLFDARGFRSNPAIRNLAHGAFNPMASAYDEED